MPKKVQIPSGPSRLSVLLNYKGTTIDQLVVHACDRADALKQIKKYITSRYTNKGAGITYSAFQS